MGAFVGIQRVARYVIRLRVRELANQRVWSEVQLARLTQVDTRIVRRLFKGPFDIECVRMSHLAKFADMFEVSVCKLIEDVMQTKETNRQANEKGVPRIVSFWYPSDGQT